MTYAKIARMTEEKIRELEGYDLVVMDECHRCGGPETKKGIKVLMESMRGAHFVGATATPDRGDAYDVVEDLFDDICVYEYTLHHAFKDGIIKPPVYTYCTYDVETDLKEEALTAGEDFNDMKVLEVIKSKLIEISKIYNIPNIMREVVNKHVTNNGYLKFIVFFDGFKQLHEKSGTVEEWFKEAFPNYSISNMIISSETKEFTENVRKLKEMRAVNHKIDLIYAVDMLNMGYHVNDLTGIIMYRGTSSSIIYTQQLGRALSSGSTESYLIFDIVDNLHRKSVFNLMVEDERAKRNHPKTKEEIEQKVKEMMESVNTNEMSEEEIEEVRNAIRLMVTGKQKWWNTCNELLEEDLYATGYEATYRELITKAIGEARAVRCKRAWEEHFKRWCELSDLPYPSSKEEMLKNADVVPPLTAYAKWQNVLVREVVDLIFSEDDKFTNAA